MKDLKYILPLGFAMFAILFGAGNIIYPPQVGFVAGEHWFIATLGFIVTATGFAVLGFSGLVFTKNGYIDVTKRIHPKLHVYILGAIFIIIGPLFAIPRTSIVTNAFLTSELIGLYLPAFVVTLISSIIFFGLTALLLFTGSSIVEIVGKYLTPVLLVLLTIIIIAAIVNPHGTTNNTGASVSDSIVNGLGEGYLTLDGLAYFVIFGVAYNFIVVENNDSIPQPRRNRIAFFSIGVAALLICLVYVGLGYFGSISQLPSGSAGADIIKDGITFNFGKIGRYLFGVVTMLACLTTSIGLTANTGQFFNENATRSRKYYYHIIVATLVISLFLSLLDLSVLTKFVVPILIMVYPVACFIGACAFFNNIIKSDKTLKISFFVVCVISVVSYLANPIMLENIIDFQPLEKLFSHFPLYSINLVWLPLAMVTLLVAIVTEKIMLNKKA